MIPGQSHVPREVLIVEDEPRLLDTYTEMAHLAEFEVRRSRTAEDAWRAFRDAPSPIVMLDLNLPGKDGMWLFRQLYDHHHRPSVVMLTGFGDLAVAREAIELDVVRLLTKPCHMGELEAALVAAHQQAIARAKADRLDKPALTSLTDPSPEPEPEPDDPMDAPFDEPLPLAEVERRHIRAVLQHHQGNRREAAKALGISERKLYYYIAREGWTDLDRDA